MKNEKHKNKPLGFMPLEERIVLDAALFGDLAETTFIEDSQPFFDFDHSADDLHEHHDSAADIEFHEDEGSNYTSDLIEVTLDEDNSTTVFNLGEVYPAGDILSQMGLLNFEIKDNSSPELVESSIEGNSLTINKVAQEEGAVDITVKGVFLDGKVYNAPFRVHIMSAEHDLFLYEDDNSENPWLPMDYVSINEDFDSSHDSYTKLDEINVNMLPLDQEGQSVKEYVGFFGLTSLEHAEWVSRE